MQISVRKITGGTSRREAFVQRVLSHRLLNSYAVLVVLSCACGVVIFALCTQSSVDAANPTSASLGPNSTSVSWEGTALGGATIGDPLLGLVGAEELCIEG